MSKISVLGLGSMGSRMAAHLIQAEGSLASWPEVGSRMMTRVATGEDMVGQWVVVQEGVYAYSVQQNGGLRVRSVLFEYLATEVQWEH
jgi:3-hydroxyisobutyrate dehydrogenase-like beta-hydroxyacid dehydrogenase